MVPKTLDALTRDIPFSSLMAVGPQTFRMHWANRLDAGEGCPSMTRATSSQKSSTVRSVEALEVRSLLLVWSNAFSIAEEYTSQALGELVAPKTSTCVMLMNPPYSYA